MAGAQPPVRSSSAPPEGAGEREQRIKKTEKGKMEMHEKREKSKYKLPYFPSLPIMPFLRIKLPYRAVSPVATMAKAFLLLS